MIHELLPKITDKIPYKKKRALIGYVNIYNYSIFRGNRIIIDNFDAFTLDGIFLVWVIRLLYLKKINRMSPDFSSYFTNVFKWLDSERIKTCFIGGTPEEINQFYSRIKTLYPGIRVALSLSGYGLKEKEVIDSILENKVEVIILGMGSPKQELFALSIKQSGYEGLIFTCGAFFSQTAAKGEIYYPKWINKGNIRWMYRIYKQPELFKRYFVEYPMSFVRLLRDYFLNW